MRGVIEQPVWLGHANAWESDEMGHMNVRHYLAKAADAAQLFFADLGLCAAPSWPRSQHVRYHRETRAGTPLKIYAEIVSVAPPCVTLGLRIVSAPDEVLRASILSEFEQPNWPEDFLAMAGARLRPVRAEMAPRGLAPAKPFDGPSIAIAEAQGLIEVGRMVINQAQTNQAGELQAHEVIGLLSDGVAHLMARVTPARVDANEASRIGGAALEQRIIFRHRPLAGDRVTLRSGVMGAEAKTMRFVHWLFEIGSGAPVATIEVVAVAFDLTARKAIAVDEATRARIAGMAVGLSA